MNIKQALVSYLLNTELTNLIDNRLFPLILPQDAKLPAVTYQQVSIPRTLSLKGTGDKAQPRFQFSCWASNYSEGQAVANKLRNLLDGFSGLMGENVRTSVRVASEREDYESETGRYRVDIDFLIWCEEKIEEE